MIAVLTIVLLVLVLQQGDAALLTRFEGSSTETKIMALAIHPYISGQPHRIKYLEAIYQHASRFEGVLHWNGVQILDWYLATTKASAQKPPPEDGHS